MIFLYNVNQQDGTVKKYFLVYGDDARNAGSEIGTETCQHIRVRMHFVLHIICKSTITKMAVKVVTDKFNTVVIFEKYVLQKLKN